MELSRSVLAVQAFIGEDLSGRIAEIEGSLRNATIDSYPRKLSASGATPDTLEAAGDVKRNAGQIDVVIHAVGMLLCLPHILSPGEVIEYVSLGAGNTGKAFDLETNRRIAEFKFIQWRGGPESTRQNSILKDFYKLAEFETTKQRFLYVLGATHPLAFLRGRRALASALKDHALQQEFFSKFGTDYKVVSDYYNARAHLVSVEDVSSLIPGLSIAEEE